METDFQQQNYGSNIRIAENGFLLSAYDGKTSNKLTTLYYGNMKNNLLELMVDSIDCVEGFTCVIAEEIEEKNPQIKYSNSVIYEYLCEIPKTQSEIEEGEYDDRIRGDFKFYYNTNEIVIVVKPEAEVVKVSGIDRLEYGLDQLNEMVYMKVKNLTPEEYAVLKSQKKNKKIDYTDNEKSQIDIIKEEITSIENLENVEIIGSSLIGSQAWGYSDENSDIDLRFIYLRPMKEYLSLFKKEDTISYPITDQKDIFGWDLMRFLELLSKQNSSVYEFLFSPIQFNENQYMDSLRKYAKETFSKEKMVVQYLNLLKSRIIELNNDFKNNKPIKTKFVLYILRLICMINYINEKNEFPICNFETLLSVESNEYLKNQVLSLIHMKQNGQGVYNVTVELINYLINQYEERKITINKNNENVIDKERIDNLFVEGLDYFGKTEEFINKSNEKIL